MAARTGVGAAFCFLRELLFSRVTVRTLLKFKAQLQCDVTRTIIKTPDKTPTTGERQSLSAAPPNYLVLAQKMQLPFEYLHFLSNFQRSQFG